MIDETLWSRRRVVQVGLAGSAGAALGCGSTSAPSVEEPVAECAATDDDIEGPFYVDGVPIRSDLDTWGDPGLKITLSGVIRNAECAPIQDAVIEIWQADDLGAYDNTSADMRYRGQQAVDELGAYAFTTLLPGRYLNGDEFRPAHIHVKIWVGGVERLTTQLYFEGDPFNDSDPWFDVDRSMVVAERGDGTADCVFDFSV